MAARCFVVFLTFGGHPSSLELFSEEPPLKAADGTMECLATPPLARPMGTKQDEDGFSDLPLPKTAEPLSTNVLTL